MSYQVLQNNKDSTTAAIIDATVANSWVWGMDGEMCKN